MGSVRYSEAETAAPTLEGLVAGMLRARRNEARALPHSSRSVRPVRPAPRSPITLVERLVLARLEGESAMDMEFLPLFTVRIPSEAKGGKVRPLARTERADHLVGYEPIVNLACAPSSPASSPLRAQRLSACLPPLACCCRMIASRCRLRLVPAMA